MNQMLKAEHTTCAGDPLTAEKSAFWPCANPFCNTPTTVRTGKRYRSDHCRMDGYALKRAKALLAKVGIIRFHELLDQL